MALDAEWKDKVEDWIVWIRENVVAKGEIPNVAKLNPSGLWQDEDPEELSQNSTDIFEYLSHKLAHNRIDMAVRFTASHVYHSLRTLPLDYVKVELLCCHDPSEEYDENVSDYFEALRTELEFLVHLLPVEECPPEWRIIRWEILNSQLVGDWDRALKFYGRVEDLGLREASELQLLRGQTNFIRVFGPNRDSTFDPMDWEPDIFNSSNFLRELSFILLSFPTEGDKGDVVLSDAEFEWISDAANNFEKAAKKLPDLSPAYMSALARCYFSKGDFPNAARCYRRFLGNRKVLNWGDKINDGFVNLVYGYLADSYERAGELSKAKETLENKLTEFPNESGIYPKIANLQKKQGDPLGACESWRKEEELDPSIGENPGISVAMMLAGTTGSPEEFAKRAKEHHQAKSHIYAPIESLIQGHWNTLSLLGETARTLWIDATHNLYFATEDPKLLPSKFLTASSHYATAVELELKSRVFESFRVHVSKTGTLSSPARKEKDARHRETEKFCDYLVWGKKLTLGEMQFILDFCRKAKGGISGEFNRWMDQCYSTFVKELRLLREICDLRNPATHRDKPKVEAITREDVETMAGWCRKVLEAITKR